MNPPKGMSSCHLSVFPKPHPGQPTSPRNSVGLNFQTNPSFRSGTFLENGGTLSIWEFRAVSGCPSMSAAQFCA